MRFKSQMSAIDAQQSGHAGRPLCRGDEKLRVLIAEPDHLVAMDLNTMVEDLGGQVIGTAETGEQAIALGVRLRPDIAIINILLGGDIDGVDAALDIQVQHNMPVVFVAGQADAVTVHRMHLATDQPALLKPVSLTRMRDAIVNACALSLDS
jgi:DNA-binding NarL/FixJ family response regulator